MSSKTVALRAEIAEATARLEGHMIFKHYKGGVYKFVLTIFSADTDSAAYVYQRIDGPGFNEDLERPILFVRSVESWWSQPEEGVSRFTPVTYL